MAGPLEQVDSARNGSGSTVEAIRNFLSDGDAQGAVEYARLKGVEFTPVAPQLKLSPAGKVKHMPASVTSKPTSVAEGLTQVEAGQLHEYLTAEKSKAEPAAASTGSEPASPSVAVDVDTSAIAPESVTGKELRERVTVWAKAKWGDGKSEVVENRQWGGDITITWQGIKHAISNANDSELRLIAGLRALIGKASHVDTQPDKLGRDDVKAVHTFAVKVNLGGEKLDVRIAVRELKDGHKFYDHFIIKSETPSGISGAASSVVSDGLGAPASDGVAASVLAAASGSEPKPTADESKEPWQMTRAESLRQTADDLIANGMSPEDAQDFGTTDVTSSMGIA